MNVVILIGEMSCGAEGGSRTARPFGQRILVLSPRFDYILLRDIRQHLSTFQPSKQFTSHLVSPRNSLIFPSSLLQYVM